MQPDLSGNGSRDNIPFFQSTAMPRRGRWFRYGTRFCVRERGSIDLVLDVTNTSLVYISAQVCWMLCGQSDQSCHDLKSFGLGKWIVPRAQRDSCALRARSYIAAFGPGTAAGTSGDTLAGLIWQPTHHVAVCIPLGVCSMAEALTCSPQLCSGLKFGCVVFCGRSWLAVVRRTC
jgi:hypothetical protein